MWYSQNCIWTFCTCIFPWIKSMALQDFQRGLCQSAVPLHMMCLFQILYIFAIQMMCIDVNFVLFRLLRFLVFPLFGVFHQFWNILDHFLFCFVISLLLLLENSLMFSRRGNTKDDWLVRIKEYWWESPSEFVQCSLAWETNLLVTSQDITKALSREHAGLKIHSYHNLGLLL